VNKIILHKISSLVLAVLVLLVTSSFTIEKHFCGDFLVDSSVFSELQQCKDEVCCAEGKPSNQQKEDLTEDCCKETQQVFEGNESIDFKKFDYSKNKQHSPTVTSGFSYHIANNFPEVVDLQYYYSPPNLIEVFRIRYQVFLI